MTPLETFPGLENTEARLFDLGARGFSVALVDLDVGETVPGSVRIWPLTHANPRAAARAHAQWLVAVPLRP